MIKITPQRPSLAKLLIAGLAAFLLFGGSVSGVELKESGTKGSKDTSPVPAVEGRRQELLKMRDGALERLYEIKPEAKAELEAAEGYAVFDINTIYVVLFESIEGKGVVVDGKGAKPTYMTLGRTGSSPRLGCRQYRLVLVFHSRPLLEQFAAQGAEVTDSAEPSLRIRGDSTQQYSVGGPTNPNLTVYELTDRGLALDPDWAGTAYLPDTELNEQPEPPH